jgi:OOP family OmpA-OmpF porin
VVDGAARILQGNPSVHVMVAGYTDSVGSDAYNQRLSERRAQTVARHLVENGVSESRLDVRGFGKKNPVADNGTEAGRAKNRRVEIVVE